MSPEQTQRGYSFPKKARLVSQVQYRKVYADGTRISGPLLSAFCLAVEAGEGPKVGLTVPRAIGKAVERNRVKRRLRESVRLELDRLPETVWIVLNPRKAVRTAPWPALRREIVRVFERCANS